MYKSIHSKTQEHENNKTNNTENKCSVIIVSCFPWLKDEEKNKTNEEEASQRDVRGRK